MLLLNSMHDVAVPWNESANRPALAVIKARTVHLVAGLDSGHRHHGPIEAEVRVRELV